MHLQQRGLALKLNLRAFRMAGNNLVMYLEVLLICRRKRAMTDGIPDLPQSTTSLTLYSSVVQVGTPLPNFCISGRVQHMMDLCLMGLSFTIFSLGAVLCSVNLNTLTLR